MRRLLVIAPFVLVGFDACGDDDGGGGGDALGDNPTREECIDAIVAVMESLEVPDGVDPSDGLDDDERPKADAAVEAAFDEQGIDPDDEDHPCDDLTADMTDEEFTELTKDIDPDVLALLGAQAATEFEETGDSISN